MRTSGEFPTTRHPDRVMLVGMAHPTGSALPPVGPAQERDEKNHARADRPRLASRRSGLHAIAELAIRVLAFTSIAAVILIFVFIGKEAWPLLHDSAVWKEVTLAKMWLAQL
jgi:hypothetical protein